MFAKTFDNSRKYFYFQLPNPATFRTSFMTHLDFAMLSYINQCTVLRDHGTQVSYRNDKVFEYYLFQLDAFYVEINIKRGEEKIEVIKSFTNTDNLIQYLHHVDIASLIHS